MAEPVPPSDPVPPPDPAPEPAPPAKGWVKPDAGSGAKPEPKPAEKSDTGSILGGLGILVTIGLVIARFVGGGGGDAPPIPQRPPINFDLLAPRGPAASFKVWDATTGAVLAEPTVPAGIIAAAAFSPDGKKLVGSSSEKCLFLWDLERPGAPTRLDGFSNLCFGLAFSADGTRFAAVDTVGEVRVWDAAKPGAPVAVLPGVGKGGWVSTVSFPAPDRVWVTGPDGRVKVWQLGAEPKAVIEFNRFGAWATGPGSRVAFAPDGAGAAVEIWNVVAGERVGKLAAPAKRTFKKLRFLVDDRLAAVLDDGSVRVFDATGAELFALDGVAKSAKTLLATGGDRKQLYTASRDAVAAWDARTGERVVTFPLDAEDVVDQLSRRGPYLVGTGPEDAVVVWREARDDNKTISGVRAWSSRTKVWFNDAGTVAVGRSGAGIGVGANGLALLDPGTGRTVVPLAGANRSTDCLFLTFGPNGKALAATLK